MNLATDFDFTTPSNAALSLRTIAELVRQEKLKCIVEQKDDGIALGISLPFLQSSR